MRGWALGLLTVVIVGFAAPCLLGLFFLTTVTGPQALQCLTPVQPAAALAGGPVRLPVVGSYRLTSPFGDRVHPVTGQRRPHNGLDIALSPRGGPIVAMAAGVVISAGMRSNAGNMVVLDHGGGLQSRYLHLARIDVRTGQQLQPGQQLGTEGATGRVTGPHLHWEVWVDGRPTDPAAWARAQGLVLDGTAPTAATPPPAQQRDAIGALAVATSPLPALPALATDPAARPSLTGFPPVGRWSADQVRNAAEIVAAGRALNLDEWTLTVGVMTAMGESSLVNIGHGDTVGPDSRGLFQQRANGAWGSETDRMTPRTAATNFFRALTSVSGYRQLSPTLAAHRTQRNRDPHHYQRFWEDAVLVVATILADPSLLTRLPASGVLSDCAPAPEVGGLPAGPQGDCPASGKPGEAGLRPVALRGFRCGAAAFPQVYTIYGLGQRSGASDHPRGMAVDFMIDRYRSPEGNALGWQLAEWKRTHADSLGVKYIIWDMKYWSAANPDAGWVPYTRYGPNPSDNLAHRNHVHVSYR